VGLIKTTADGAGYSGHSLPGESWDPPLYTLVWYKISLANDVISVGADVRSYHCRRFIRSCTQGLYR
jgi:hypothetical protein